MLRASGTLGNVAGRDRLVSDWAVRRATTHDAHSMRQNRRVLASQVGVKLDEASHPNRMTRRKTFVQ